jgi:hypothetical protein
VQGSKKIVFALLRQEAFVGLILWSSKDKSRDEWVLLLQNTTIKERSSELLMERNNQNWLKGGVKWCHIRQRKTNNKCMSWQQTQAVSY